MTANPSAAKIVNEWKYDPSPLIGCRFDPQLRYVFAGAQDQHVVRLELSSGKFTAMKGHDSWLRAIGFTNDGDRCWTAGYDGRLVAWETAAETPQPLQTIEAHEGWIRSLHVSPDQKFLATAGNDLAVRIWDASTGNLVHTCQGHDRHVYSALFSADGHSLFSGDLRGVVKRWNVDTGELLADWAAKELYSPNPGQGAEYGGVRSMAYDTQRKELYCGGLHKATNPFGAIQEPLIMVLNAADGSTVRTHTVKDGPKAICWRVAWHPEGFLMGGCGGQAGGLICFWRPDAEIEFHRLQLPNTVLDMDLAHDGSQVATVHYDRHVRLTQLVPQA
ncbi:MAG: hypothetical protein KDA60_16705 [Planctomycetales bacterium]|nr:hypothetical protein [Planctomycetales bacterium]